MSFTAPGSFHPFVVYLSGLKGEEREVGMRELRILEGIAHVITDSAYSLSPPPPHISNIHLPPLSSTITTRFLLRELRNCSREVFGGRSAAKEGGVRIEPTFHPTRKDMELIKDIFGGFRISSLRQIVQELNKRRKGGRGGEEELEELVGEHVVKEWVDCGNLLMDLADDPDTTMDSYRTLKKMLVSDMPILDFDIKESIFQEYQQLFYVYPPPSLPFSTLSSSKTTNFCSVGFSSPLTASIISRLLKSHSQVIDASKVKEMVERNISAPIKLDEVLVYEMEEEEEVNSSFVPPISDQDVDQKDEIPPNIKKEK